MGVVLTNAEENQIRRWMGYSRLYKQLYPKLENAFIAVRSVDDDGTQEDDSGVIMIQGWIVNLTTLEQQELNLSCQMAVMTAGTDKVTLDAAGRGIYGLRKIMARYIGHISDTLSTALYRNTLAGTGIVGPDADEDAGDLRISDYGSIYVNNDIYSLGDASDALFISDYKWEKW